LVPGARAALAEAYVIGRTMTYSYATPEQHQEFYDSKEGVTHLSVDQILIIN